MIKKIKQFFNENLIGLIFVFSFVFFDCLILFLSFYFSNGDADLSHLKPYFDGTSYGFVLDIDVNFFSDDLSFQNIINFLYNSYFERFMGGHGLSVKVKVLRIILFCFIVFVIVGFVNSFSKK